MRRLSLVGGLRRLHRGTLCRFALHFPGLVRWLHTPRPLAMLRHAYPRDATSRDLLVLLPGIADSADDFERYGFVDRVRTVPWPVDLVLVDAHYGYYADRTVLHHLHDDVFEPAKQCGYRHVWVAGISMGGFGALLYASRFPAEVAGVLALAPFLGGHELIDEIAAAGGLGAWRTSHVAADDFPRQVWTWLDHCRQAHSGPSLYLAFGDRDIFVRAQRLLAAAMPDDQVLIEPGTHGWSTWTRLWERFVRERSRLREQV